ncbi:MAG: ankyrin repeat domain-containing protein [Candidatus Berkiellales bacterium]
MSIFDNIFNFNHQSHFSNWLKQDLQSKKKLLKAAKMGDLEQLKAVIADGVNVNSSSFEPKLKENPLYHAVVRKQFEAVKILVQHGADVNFADSKSSVLYVAVETGRPDIVKYLLENGATYYINQQVSYFNSRDLPLALAAHDGNVEIAKILVDHGADVNAKGGLFGRSIALIYAAAKAHIPMMKFLIDHGSEVNTFNHSDDNPLLFLDAYLKTTPPQRYNSLLMEASVSSPLYCALKNKDAIKLLLDSGANDLGWSPLHKAVITQDAAAAEALLSSDNNLVNVKDKIGFTPMHLALLADDNSYLELLANHGADPNLTQTPLSLLHTAVMLNVPQETFQWVINHTDNLNSHDIFKTTTLGYAASIGRLEHMKSLLAAGADINAQDQNGNPPLHIAVNGKQVEAVKLLIEHGADLFAEDSNDNTAFDLANSFRQFPADLLLELHPKNQKSLVSNDILTTEDTISPLLDKISPHSQGNQEAQKVSTDPGKSYVYSTPVVDIIDNALHHPAQQHIDAPG